MKRCPECRRDYYDDSLLYCLDDGSSLLEGPASVKEPATAILPETVLPGEAQTKPQIQPLQGTSPSTFAGWKGWVVGAIAAVFCICGYFGYRAYSSPAEIRSIAVLPFENRSSNADTDYLSDGLTDSLIFRFSQLPNLKVSPTSSVMRYKGAAKDVSEIARELDVDGVLSGRLTQLGDNLSISVQLIDARTKKLVWAEQYDRKMADLLATQREIATTLTQKMQLGLAGDEKGIAKKYTNSNDAYQLYLKGRYHWSRRSKEDLDKAIESYREAISLDPNFALAYIGLAEVYNSMGKNPSAAPKDCIPAGKAAAMRALELDPSIAEGHSALADSLAVYYWDWAQSEREFKRAIELDPNISYIHLAYSGSFLSAADRQDEGIREAERAVELEPLSLINNSILASAYVLGRQYDKGLKQAQRTIDLDPNFPLGKFCLGIAYIANGKYDDAIAVNRDVPETSLGGNALFVIALANARVGRRAEAEQAIAKLREISKTQYVRTYCIAWAYAALGDKDKAFAELEKSFEDRDCYLGRARVDPFMDPLRDDPRFSVLMKSIGLYQ